jgi:hypothetical protein
MHLIFATLVGALSKHIGTLLLQMTIEFLETQLLVAVVRTIESGFRNHLLDKVVREGS